MTQSSEAVELVFLGTGTSHGIPMIGCDCPVCTSDDPHDKRTRPSVVVRFGGKSVLIDTAPELRLQCVANGIAAIDAVLFTHAHADHVTGFDDLRRFNYLCGGAVNCYATATTARSIRSMFAYAFRDEPGYLSTKPEIDLREISPCDPLVLFEREIVPIPLLHGTMDVLGFRFGDVAYCTDCNEIPPASRALLEDLDVLVLDGLRRRPHPTHFNLEQAVEVARQLNPRRTYFTHIAHELGHEETNAQLPEGMALAHDGQVIVSPSPSPSSEV